MSHGSGGDLVGGLGLLLFFLHILLFLLLDGLVVVCRCCCSGAVEVTFLGRHVRGVGARVRESFAAVFALERFVASVDADVLLCRGKECEVSLKCFLQNVQRFFEFTFRWCLNLKAFPQSEHLNLLRPADSS